VYYFRLFLTTSENLMFIDILLLMSPPILTENTEILSPSPHFRVDILPITTQERIDSLKCEIAIVNELLKIEPESKC
jgi:hypothetical protein